MDSSSIKLKSKAMENCEIKYKKIFDQGRYSGLLELSDAKIFTEDGSSFDIHKIILAKRSDFFRAMFCGLEKGKKIYKISNISGHLLSDILVFIYTKYLCVTETNINELLTAADFFCLKPLYSKIKSQIKANLRNHNCLKLYLTSYQINDSEILHWCLNYIAPRFEDIISCQKSDLDDFPFEFLKSILSNGSLYLKSESTIWQVIVHWVQACPQSRLKHVTSLLSTLAICEVDANLSREIVNHEIISHIRALNNTISHMNLNRPKNILKCIIDGFKPNEFRIPQKLSLVSENTTRQSVKIFISFDEAVVFWYEICEVPIFIAESVIAVGSNVYLFEYRLSISGGRCVKFNFKTMKWEIYEKNYHKNICTTFTVNTVLYTLVHENETYHIDEYDVEKNRCFRISSLNNFDYASATAIGEEIFVVGTNSDLDINITRMFNVVTHQWTDLSTPNEFRERCKLVPYHNKIYLVDYSERHQPEVEVFDPAINVWKILPKLTENCYGFDVITLGDKLIIYNIDYGRSGGMEESTAEFWNESEECWEILERPALPDDMRWYRSCSITDVDSIKILSKRTRNSKMKMEKSPFNNLY